MIKEKEKNLMKKLRRLKSFKEHNSQFWCMISNQIIEFDALKQTDMVNFFSDEILSRMAINNSYARTTGKFRN